MKDLVRVTLGLLLLTLAIISAYIAIFMLFGAF